MSVQIENFLTDTGQFDIFGANGSGAHGTLTITGTEGDVTSPFGGFGSGGTLCRQNAFTPITSASVLVTANTNQQPWPLAANVGGYLNFVVGISADTHNGAFFECHFDHTTPTTFYLDILLFIGGVQHNVAGTTLFGVTQSPDAIGFGLNGNIITAWFSYGGVWQSVPAITFDASAIYDFTAPGALTGWSATMGCFNDAPIPNPPNFISYTQLRETQPFSDPTTLVTVPNVVGDTEAAAIAALSASGLNPGTINSVSSLTVPVGDVISQNPIAGTNVNFGSTVNLDISIGASSITTVPDLTNASVTVTVPALLSAANLVVGLITYVSSGTVIAGNVITQSPAPGTSVLTGSAVNITVSTGLPALRVPDLFGLSQSQAIIALLTLGLVPGAIGSAPSQFVPPGEVQTQNPTAGAPVAVGTIVSFVLSLGTPAVGTAFDFEATVISQYANSPVIMQLVQNLNQYIDQSTNFANFFNYVWNVDTAVGFGLDIWGKIVNVSRLLQIPNTTKYVGFDIASESQPAQDWTPAGSSQPPYNNPPVGGAFYTGHNATEAYLLDDDSYRQLILAKAFANICTTTAPAINQILQNLYGPGTAWVLNDGPMAISYNLSFTPSAIQLAILEQSGVIPTPPGVSVTINTNV